MVRLFGHFWKRHVGVLLSWSLAVGLGTVALAAWGWIGWGFRQHWRSQWEHLQLQVFCRVEMVPVLQQLIERSGIGQAVRVLPPEEGWRMVERELGLTGHVAGVDTLLPALLSVRLREGATPQQLRELYEQLRRAQGVYTVTFPWQRFSELLWQRAVFGVGWYGCGGGVGLLWCAFVWAVLAQLCRHMGEYGVLILLGISPGRLRLLALLGMLSAAGLGVLGAAGGAVLAWYLLWLNFAAILPTPSGMLVDEGRWIVAAAVGWGLFLVGLPLGALQRCVRGARLEQKW